MIRIAMTQAAFDAIASTLPLGSVAVEPEDNGRGERTIWLAPKCAEPAAGDARAGGELQRRDPADRGWGGATVTMRAAIIAVLFCTTSFQGYRVCDDGHGYRSTEWRWQDRTIGEDNEGRAWSTSRFHDMDIITGTPPR